MADIPHGRQVSTAVDDLDSVAARFEEDVARIFMFVNGQEWEDYLTADDRLVPSLSKVVANVEDMIAPDVATIMQGAASATQAATQAQASAASASQDAQGAANATELVESYAVTVAADAATARDSADRADSSSEAAGSARDTAVAAQYSVQQNADRASTAASNAAASQSAAGESAEDARASAEQTGLDVAAANQQAGYAAASAVAASGAEDHALDSAAAAAQSAMASAASAVLSAQHAAGIDPANFVRRTGETMTGELTMRAAIPMQTPDGVNRFVLATDGVNNGFINGARNQWNLNVLDDGRAIFRNQVQITAGGLYSLARTTVRNADIQLQGGPNNWSMFMRYDPSGASARMEWVNDAQNAVIAALDNAGSLWLGNSMTTVANIQASGEIRAFGSLVAHGSVFAGAGTATMSPDGNLTGGVWGDWLSNWLNGQFNARDVRMNSMQADINNRAVMGAQVQHNSGIAESAAFSGGAADAVFDMGNPWVVQGIRTQSGPGWMWLRSVWLRNQ